MALDQVTVEYNANIGTLQADLAGAEAAMRKTDQAGVQSAGRITNAFKQPIGIIQKLQDQLKNLQDRQQRALNPATVQLFNKKIDETRAKIQALTGGVKESGQSMVSTFRNIASSVGIAFSVQTILRFGKELFTLGLRAEETQAAFNKLNKPELLGGLRSAVSGTVDDVTLMQSALSANSLKLPLEDLATLFEFAERRASSLGKSTEQFINLAIEGIGRRAKGAFGELGIDVFTVQKNLKGLNFETASIADVSQAMSATFREELDKMGENVDSKTDKVQRATAAISNFKTSIGTGMLTILGVFIESIEQVASGFATIDEMGQRANRTVSTWRRFIEDETDVGEIDAAIEQANKKIETGNELLSESVDINQNVKIINRLNEIQAEKTRLEELKRIAVLRQTTSTLGELQAKQKGLAEQLIDLFVGTAEFNKVNDELKKVTDQITLATGGQTQAMKDNAAEREKQAEAARKFNESQTIAKKDIVQFLRLLPILQAAQQAVTDSGQTVENLDKEAEDREKRIAIAIREARAVLQLQQETTADKIKLFEFERDQELKNEELTQSERLLVIQKYAALIKGVEDQVEQDRTDRFLKTIDQIRTAAQAITDIIGEIGDKRLNQELEILDAQRKSQLDSLDTQLENEKLTNKQRTALLKQRENVEESFNKRIETAREEAAKDQLKFTIAGIILNQASAIGAAISGAVAQNFGNPIGIAATLAIVLPLILSGFAQALSAANAVQLAEGEVDLRGPGTKKSDSIPARLSRGESVITADGTTLDPDLLRAMNRGESEFLKHIQVNYVWPYMEQVIKAHSKAEAKGLNFTDKNLLKELRTGNKLQIKTTQAMIAAMRRSDNNRGKRA